MAALLTDINQAGLGRGLLFELFRPATEVVTGEFTEQPITIKVTGTYDDLASFASDISMMPRIVTLNEINIVPTTGTGGQLSLDAIAKLIAIWMRLNFQRKKNRLERRNDRDHICSGSPKTCSVKSINLLLLTTLLLGSMRR